MTTQDTIEALWDAMCALVDAKDPTLVQVEYLASKKLYRVTFMPLGSCVYFTQETADLTIAETK